MIGTKAQCITFLANAPDDKKRYEVKEHRERRSLNANSYYWQMVGQLAKLTGISAARIHNNNLRTLGQVERIEGKIISLSLPDTDEAEAQILESSTYHLMPTSQTRSGRDGVDYRTYIMLRGSHTFDVREFSALLDIVIQDAEAQGIETVTETEKQKMLERYGVQIKKKQGN